MEAMHYNEMFYGGEPEPVIPIIVSRLTVALGDETLSHQLDALECYREMLLSAAEG
jgi:hypothetical protein